jgi:hypothetical protein
MSTYRIVNARDNNKYLRSDIDSSGMSVCFVTGANHADDFQTAEDASSFISRVQERYPETLLMVVKETDQ